MNVAMVHCFYRWRGGEDSVFESERRLLEANGASVTTYTASNESITDEGLAAKVRLAVNTVWNVDEYRKLRAFFSSGDFQVAHFHNTFPLLSPASYHAARAARVPVVQTLHNYRLLCPNAEFLRDGAVCEDCLGRRVKWPGVLHACYRDSRGASAVTAAMLAAHSVGGTWRGAVDAYIALTEFGRQKHIEGGLPADRIFVKPNFVYPDRGFGEGDGGYALFAGRHQYEKGIPVLIEAAARLQGRVPVKVLGEGPLTAELRRKAAAFPGIEFLGRVSEEEKTRLFRRAMFLVFPSVWYEGFPMVIAEALNVGLPVISSRLGSMASIIEEGRNGLFFPAGDADALAAAMEALASDPARREEMRRAARQDALEKYSPEANYQQLRTIYAQARDIADQRA